MAVYKNDMIFCFLFCFFADKKSMGGHKKSDNGSTSGSGTIRFARSMRSF
jgi:hypothetical protein